MQYFWSALSDNWSWNPIFGLFASDRFTHALLYYKTKTKLKTTIHNTEELINSE